MKLSERAADAVSEFGGSWKFVFIFTTFFALWIILNVNFHGFDQYPFIFLNLVLSTLAVFQAPFILMSQNRASDIDRQRAELDYQSDLRAEEELRLLHAKIDRLLDKTC